MKKYNCVCHGCGKFWDKMADFLHSPLGIMEKEGKEYVVTGCDECIKVPNKIAMAYDRIMNGGPTIPEV